jgi:hypothetical protein
LLVPAVAERSHSGLDEVPSAALETMPQPSQAYLEAVAQGTEAQPHSN